MREVSPWLRQSGKRADGASIVSEVLVRYIGSRGRRIVRLLAALGLLLAGCASGGDSGQPSAPSAPSTMVERQAIDNLLTLYQEALVAEDSDRLQALLAPAAALGQAQTTTAPRQDSTGTFTDLAAFQDALRATFQQSTVTALAIPPKTVVIAPDQGSVMFLEVESILDQPDAGAAHAGVSHHLAAPPHADGQHGHLWHCSGAAGRPSGADHHPRPGAGGRADAGERHDPHCRVDPGPGRARPRCQPAGAAAAGRRHEVFTGHFALLCRPHPHRSRCACAASAARTWSWRIPMGYGWQARAWYNR